MSNRWKAGFIQAFFDPLEPGAAAFLYELYSFGGSVNNFGQLGLGVNTPRSSPTQVASPHNWEQVATDQQGATAIRSDGTWWAWGRSNNGQTGQDQTTVNYSSPVQIGALTSWQTLSHHNSNITLAIKTDGTLWGVGRNNNGQLGQNDIVNRSSPVQIGSDTDWASVNSLGNSTVAVKTNGTLWGWGRNSWGQFGTNDIINRSSPIQLGTDTDWAYAFVGDNDCFAVKTGGELYHIGGRNAYGQSGLNDEIARSSTTQVGALTNWDNKLSVSNIVTFAIKTDGTLWCMGQNGNPLPNQYGGALGLNDIISRSSPTQVGALTTWLDVSTRTYATSAVKTDGTLWFWGWNGQTPTFPYYQSPLNSNGVDYSSPVQAGAAADWNQIKRGDYFGLVVKKIAN